MTNILRFLCAVLLCGLVAVPAFAQYLLSEDELTRLMAGTTVETTSLNNWDRYFTFNTDGTINARTEASWERLDWGKWWTKVSADGSAMFCAEFDEINRGKKFCRSFKMSTTAAPSRGTKGTARERKKTGS